MKHPTTALVLILGGYLVGCGDDGMAGIDGSLLRPDGDMDLDLDGIKDDVDNCPASTNAFQGNEDGDKFGDACDPCPIISDDNPPDGDNDGVADACDPKPIMFGDRIAFFEGFHQGKPSGWDEVGTTWGAASDALTANLTGAGSFALIVTDRTRETITAEITVVSAAGAASQVGVLDNLLQNGTPAVACTITGAPAVRVYATANGTGAVSPTFELTAGQTYQVRMQRENSTYTCTARNTASAATATATTNIALNNTPYLSGLTINAANMRVRWFMIVESL